ncbi:hypothetical protein LJB77_01715 [Ruminococcaceae bacterium OttesenSCG-928-N02]|nr:hypothetical protein [Ruminococcaceae bacterium OttesenSCG-928-N02]
MHLLWGGNPKELYEFDPATKEKVFVNTYESFEQDPRYSANIVETAYSAEIMNFFGVIKGEELPLYDFEKDARVLKVIDDIER